MNGMFSFLILFSPKKDDLLFLWIYSQRQSVAALSSCYYVYGGCFGSDWNTIDVIYQVLMLKFSAVT
ncbi:MAG: hypothetical protein ACN6OB_22125 [Chryseobacterium jejuense]|uniref:hypothetical protein n=1 Tax=Chryseobacterium jejuense TaxID=445960 RepID=UPI003D0AD2F9